MLVAAENGRNPSPLTLSKMLTSRLFLLILGLFLAALSLFFSSSQNQAIIDHLQEHTDNKANTIVNKAETGWRHINKTIDSLSYWTIDGSQATMTGWLADTRIIIDNIRGLESIAIADPELKIMALSSRNSVQDAGMPQAEQQAVIGKPIDSIPDEPQSYSRLTPVYDGNTLQGFLYSTIDLRSFLAPLAESLIESYSLRIQYGDVSIYEHGDWLPYNSIGRFQSRKTMKLQDDIVLHVELVPTRSYVRAERFRALNTLMIMLLLTSSIILAVYLAQKNYILSRLSEHRFRHLMETVQLAAVHVDTDGTVTFCNDYFLEQTGWSRDEVIGKNSFSLFLDGDSGADAAGTEIQELYRRMMRGEFFTPHTEVEITTRSGEKLWFHFNQTLIKNARDEIVGLSGLGENITSRRKAEAALKLQSAALNATANAVLITDPDGIILWCNTAYSELSGYSVSEILGCRPEELIESGKHDQDFYREMWDTIRLGNVWRGEIINKRRDGTVYPEYETITPVVDSDGVIINFVAVKEDISERRAMQEENQRLTNQLYQNQKIESLGQLAGGIAHDFNNLLVPIIGYAEMGMTDLDIDEIRSYFQQILKAADRAAGLTRQILAYSRRQVLSLEPVLLNALIEDFRDMLGQATRENINLNLQLESGLSHFAGDAGQLEQVILNLVLNAADAMPEGGSVLLRTDSVTIRNKADRVEIFSAEGEFSEQQNYRNPTGALAPKSDSLIAKAFKEILDSDIETGKYVLLSVSDSGSGIEPENLTRIFDPFYTTKPRGEGTGLGLSTVFGIVEQHKGRIWLNSTPHVGTIFYCLFPAADQITAPSHKVHKELIPAGNETILVVDDTAEVRGLVTEMLRASGFKVFAASGAEEALRLVAEHADILELLITDVVMPEISGPELYSMILERLPGLPAIFMSGYSDLQLQDTFELHPEVPYLQKPFTLQELLRAINKMRDVRESV
jgi:two-component system, cell cycle sensor histidine kinase and response regulator CckA